MAGTPGPPRLSCGSKTARFLLFVFNVIFWLIGAVILGVGIWVLVDKSAMKMLEVASVSSSDALVRSSAITFIVIGAIIFVTGFLGCCGALKESPFMLLMYAIIVGFILFLQIVAGIMAAVFKDRILSQLGTSMNATVNERYGDQNFTALTSAFNFVQKEFKCCGALNGPSDWLHSSWYKEHEAINASILVPVTCCPLVDTAAEVPVAKDLSACEMAAKNITGREGQVYMTGCTTRLEDWIKGHAGILIGIAFGLAFIQAFGIVLACCLRSAIKKGYETV